MLFIVSIFQIVAGVLGHLPATTPAITAPVAVVTPAPAVVAPVVRKSSVVAVTPAPVAAVIGSQPVGPTQTVTQTQCVVNWTGTTSQTVDGPTEMQTNASGSFAEDCADAYAWTPPAGVTFTVTVESTSYETASAS